MNKYIDVTKEELSLMQYHHRKFEYNEGEQMQVFNLVRKYINPHQSTCTSCSSNLRDAKNALNTFYLEFKDKIEYNLFQSDKAVIEVKEVLIDVPVKAKPKRKR